MYYTSRCIIIRYYIDTSRVRGFRARTRLSGGRRLNEIRIYTPHGRRLMGCSWTFGRKPIWEGDRLSCGTRRGARATIPPQFMYDILFYFGRGLLQQTVILLNGKINRRTREQFTGNVMPYVRINPITVLCRPVIESSSAILSPVSTTQHYNTVTAITAAHESRVLRLQRDT